MLKHFLRDLRDLALRSYLCIVRKYAINSEPNNSKRSSEKSVQPLAKTDVSVLEIKILITVSTFSVYIFCHPVLT